MTQFQGIVGEHLLQYVTRIEKLEAEKQDIADNVKDAYGEAKGNGFEPKIIRKIIALRKLEENERNEQEEILDLYKAALGMIPEFESKGE